MATATAPLPTGWSIFLDEMRLRLDQAVAAADARMTQYPALDAEPRGQGHRQQIAQWNERLLRLTAFLEAAEQIVQSVDDALNAEENRLRLEIAKNVATRQKLTAKCACAIG